MLVLGLTFIIEFANAQTSAVLGRVSQGVATLTNEAEAARVLKGGLSASATISDIVIDWSPTENAFFLLGRVSNDKVSGKAIQLVLEGEVLRASGGPGIEITCEGINCASCLPEVKKWKPRCVCHDNPKQSDWECNMTSKISISSW